MEAFHHHGYDLCRAALLTAVPLSRLGLMYVCLFSLSLCRSVLLQLFRVHKLPPQHRIKLQQQLRRDLGSFNELYHYPTHWRRRAYTLSILVTTLGVLVVAVRVSCCSEL